jgi:type IV secretory pathway VirB10-like protein
MRWFAETDTDGADVSVLRESPGRAPGMSPPRIFLLVLFGGVLLTAWLIMPLSSWVSGWWSGFGQTREQPPPTAPPRQEDQALNSLKSHHVPKRPGPPPVTDAPPVQETPKLSVVDDVTSQYDALAKKYADLEAWVKGQGQKGAEPTPRVHGTTTKDSQTDDAAKRAREEAKRKREAVGKSEPIFLTRKKDDPVGQLHALKSPYSLAPSETIPCETTMEMSSDTPGAFVAIVRADVPDTATRQHNVLPKGSKFVLKPRGKTIFGDSRIDIQTHTLTFPGGSWLKMPTHTVTDRSGTAGFTGEIDRHLWRIYGSVILMRVLDSGTTMAVNGSGAGVGERVGAAVGQGVASETSRQARQSMNTAPTVTVPTTYECQILLEDELVLTRSFGRMP